MQLNLPQYTFKSRDNRGQLEIFCPLRRKWLVLTPEEYVRQQVIQHLHLSQGFELTWMKSEVSIPLPSGVVRSDLVVYNPDGSVEGIVECKAPQVMIDESVLHQANKYHFALKAKWVLLTNGFQHLCFAGIIWEESWPQKN